MIARLYGQTRGAQRHAVEIDATLRGPDREAVDIVIEDLSASGFCIPSVSNIEPGTRFSIGFPGLGIRSATAVRDASGRYGCKFAEQLSESELKTALSAEPLEPLALRPGQPVPVTLTRPPEPLRTGLPIAVQAMLAMAAAAAGWWLLR